MRNVKQRKQTMRSSSNLAESSSQVPKTPEVLGRIEARVVIPCLNKAERLNTEAPMPMRSMATTTTQNALKAAGPSLSGHLAIMRADHWIKNVFVLPGIVVGLAFDKSRGSTELIGPIAFGTVSVCLVASSNYVINELLDARHDRFHPTKCTRPVPSGRVSIPLAYVQWIAVMLLGIAAGWQVSHVFAETMAALWIMGCIYNIRPLRSKDVPYLDVLSEAVNNPLRMLAGWYIVSPPGYAPASLLMSYWMVGCYFMAIKRYAELRHFGDRSFAASYRKSFGHYTEERLLVSIMFYSAAAMLFLGAFIIRYRVEMILCFPLVALVMAIYLALAFKDNSAAQAPERLHKEPVLMVAVVTCTAVSAMLLFMDIPLIARVFAATPH
jgi:decaprenyl-phosphate phosphoribosyltransferase